MKKKEVEQNKIDKILNEVKQLKLRTRITDKEIYLISKKFFLELLDLKEELTFEEIIEELKRTYIEKDKLEQCIFYLKKINKLEYLSEEHNQDELKEDLVELEKLIILLKEKSDKKETFFEKIKTKIKNKLLLKEEQKILELTELIRKANETETFKQRMRHYKKARKIYNHTSEKNKSYFYEALSKTYHKLKAEEK